MASHLVITIRLHDVRYHGVPEWPPAPARVFQALVAGVARANRFADDVQRELEWLESLPPPIVAAPAARAGKSVSFFVPNNDADTLGGDLDRISEIRTRKQVTPRLLAGEAAFLYAWPIAGETDRAAVVATLADHLYQLGRGVDMAWATAEVVDQAELDERLLRHRGSALHPTVGPGRHVLACPTRGSLASLVRRFDEMARRLRPEGAGQIFVQPPRPRFVSVAYDAVPSRWVYELRQLGRLTEFYRWPLARAAELVTRARDGAADRLKRGLPGLAGAVDQVLIGRKADGSDAAPTAWRIRIIPLPSIGHEHADRIIRRVLVEVPSGGPLAPADVRWAFSGLELDAPGSPPAPAGDDRRVVLTTTEQDGHAEADEGRTQTPERAMLRRYVVSSDRWRTITAAALPEAAGRRRIEPTRRREEAKGASERAHEEERAAQAICVALRHAGVPARPVHIHVQREPFDADGERAEAFAGATRFAKERLWHVELELDRPVPGPVVLGDGRFLGLGFMVPQSGEHGVLAFEIAAGLSERADPIALARALRRTIMARVQATLDDRWLPPFFSGHDETGGPARSERSLPRRTAEHQDSHDEAEEPARSERSSHLAFHFDAGSRLLIVAPHALDRRDATETEREHLVRLSRAVQGLVELRAGSAGLLKLRASRLDADRDVLCTPSRRWVSLTPYLVQRHPKHMSPGEALAADIQADCQHRGLPRPEVTVERVHRVARRGLQGHVTLEFPVAVPGPLALGRSRYVGGGLFAAERAAID